MYNYNYKIAVMTVQVTYHTPLCAILTPTALPMYLPYIPMSCIISINKLITP